MTRAAATYGLASAQVYGGSTEINQHNNARATILSLAVVAVVECGGFLRLRSGPTSTPNRNALRLDKQTNVTFNDSFSS